MKDKDHKSHSVVGGRVFHSSVSPQVRLLTDLVYSLKHVVFDIVNISIFFTYIFIMFLFADFKFTCINHKNSNQNGRR